MYHGLHWMKNLFTNFHISKSPFVSIKKKEKKKKRKKRVHLGTGMNTLNW